MAMFFGYQRLTKPEDWKDLAGAGKWVRGRSAHELAHAWQAAGGMPPAISQVLDQSKALPLHGIILDLCLVEKPVFLDTQRAPSMTDVMAYGRNGGGERVVVAVEGKADEPFALRTCAWLRGDSEHYEMSATPKKSRMSRLAYLAERLGLSLGPDCRLRYQLLHRTVSVLSEAQLHGAAAALVLVHAFGEVCQGNWDDFVEFLVALNLQGALRESVAGPAVLSGVPTFFLWHQNDIRRP
jgi:hypothetical protein